MNLITDGQNLANLFSDLIISAREFYWAVAWATSHSEVFPLLKKNRQKIRQLIIGTHFYQTDPVVMKEFYKEQSVRFILKPTGVFHPKVFMFCKDNSWDCIIGSANLSKFAFRENDECVIHVSSRDHNSSAFKNQVLKAIKGYWEEAKSISQKDIAEYSERWEKKWKLLKKVSEEFDDKKSPGKTTLEIPILRMTWPEFVAKVKEEDDGGSVEPRLRVIEAIQLLFEKYISLNNMNYLDRQKIGGLTYDKQYDFRWFGSMLGAGRFKHLIKENNPQLSKALDIIPFSGDINQDIYRIFIKEIKKAFPDGGVSVAVASRLLAMKRPDIFICFDSKNRIKLAKAFNIAQSVNFDGYWNSIIERIIDSTWWQVPSPSGGIEKRLWNGRSAMLDALFYEKNK